MQRLALKSILFLLYHLQTYLGVPPSLLFFSVPGPSSPVTTGFNLPRSPKYLLPSSPPYGFHCYTSACFFLSSCLQSSFSLSIKQPNSKHTEQTNKTISLDLAVLSRCSSYCLILFTTKCSEKVASMCLKRAVSCLSSSPFHGGRPG